MLRDAEFAFMHGLFPYATWYLRERQIDLERFVYALAKFGIADAKMRFKNRKKAHIYRTQDNEEEQVLATLVMPKSGQLNVVARALPEASWGELMKLFPDCSIVFIQHA